MLRGDDIASGDWFEVFRQPWDALPAGLSLALTAIINAQLPASAKERIVFMRWTNPLPGCEAFSRYAKSDPRVDAAFLERTFGPLPTDAAEQNALWYRLYKSVEFDPSVLQAHKAFLFARDYTSIALMMSFFLGTIGFIVMPDTHVAIYFLVFLIFQFVIGGQAARNHGKRLITTVLAIKGAGK